MPVTLSPEAKQLIDRPNFAHLATLMPDGSPNATPVWVGREGDCIAIRASRCPLWTLPIPTKKCRSAAASSKAAPTLT